VVQWEFGSREERPQDFRIPRNMIHITLHSTRGIRDTYPYALEWDNVQISSYTPRYASARTNPWSPYTIFNNPQEICIIKVCIYPQSPNCHLVSLFVPSNVRMAGYPQKFNFPSLFPQAVIFSFVFKVQKWLALSIPTFRERCICPWHQLFFFEYPKSTPSTDASVYNKVESRNVFKIISLHSCSASKCSFGIPASMNWTFVNLYGLS